METAALPAINPPYSRTAVGAHVVGVLDRPTTQLAEVVDALVEDGTRLSEISVFGRRLALGEFDPDIDRFHRPQASRILHLFDVGDRELRRYKRALEANEAVISVRVDAFERRHVADILTQHGASDVAFYSRRHNRAPIDDFATKGNAALSKRRRF